MNLSEIDKDTQEMMDRVNTINDRIQNGDYPNLDIAHISRVHGYPKIFIRTTAGKQIEVPLPLLFETFETDPTMESLAKQVADQQPMDPTRYDQWASALVTDIMEHDKEEQNGPQETT